MDYSDKLFYWFIGVYIVSGVAGCFIPEITAHRWGLPAFSTMNGIFVVVLLHMFGPVKWRIEK